LRTICH